MDQQLSRNYPLLKEIIAAHSWKREYERYMPIIRYAYRPMGFLATWIAIRFRITTETASYISGVLGVAGCILLLSKNHTFLLSGIIFLHLFNLMDCVDGSIARSMQTENAYGKFLDSVLGDIVDYPFYIIIGIMAYLNPNLLIWSEPFGKNEFLWLPVGCLSALCFIFIRHFELLYEVNIQGFNPSGGLVEPKEGIKRGESKRLAVAVADSEGNENWRYVIRLIDRNIRARESSYLLLVICYFTKAIDLFLIFYAIYNFSFCIATGLVFISRMKKKII